MDVAIANKIQPGSLVQSVLEGYPVSGNEEVGKRIDQMPRELKGHDIDERFREALRRGETSGDFVILDEYGNEIVNALPSKSICDF